MPQRPERVSIGDSEGDGCGVLAGVGDGEGLGAIVTVGNGVLVKPWDVGGVSVGVVESGVAFGAPVGNDAGIATVAVDGVVGIAGGSGWRSQATSPSPARISPIRKARRNEPIKV